MKIAYENKEENKKILKYLGNVKNIVFIFLFE